MKAGGGCVMTIGSMLQHWLTKLDWFSTLFPRIPVSAQKKIEDKLRQYNCKYDMIAKNMEDNQRRYSDQKDSSNKNSDNSHQRERHR